MGLTFLKESQDRCANAREGDVGQEQEPADEGQSASDAEDDGTPEIALPCGHVGEEAFGEVLDSGGETDAQEDGEKGEDEQGWDGENPFDEGACVFGEGEHDEGDQAEEEKVDHAQTKGAPWREVETSLSLGNAGGEECADDEEVGAEGDGQQEDDKGEAKDVGHDFSKGFRRGEVSSPFSGLGTIMGGGTPPLRAIISQ